MITYFPDNHVMQLPPFKVADSMFECGQYEIAPSTNKLHWQGFFYFANARSFASVKAKCPENSHIEAMHHTPKHCIDYCSKSAPEQANWTAQGIQFRWSRGDAPVASDAKKESESSLLLTAIKDGQSVAQITSAFPTLALRSYQNILKLMEVHAPKYKYDLPEQLRDWQRKLILHLCYQSDDRKILWFYDPRGGAGKSTVVRYCMNKMSAALLEGRVIDMAYTYKCEPIVFFDLSRSQDEKIDHLYAFAEKLKNGILPSTKYESTVKNFPSPHVVFFSNSLPDSSKWTEDRLHLTTLSNPITFAAVPNVAPTFVACARKDKLLFKDVYDELA